MDDRREPGPRRPRPAPLPLTTCVLRTWGLAVSGLPLYGPAAVLGVVPWILAERAGLSNGPSGVLTWILAAIATAIGTAVALGAIGAHVASRRRGERRSFAASAAVALSRWRACAGIALRSLGHLFVFIVPAAIALLVGWLLLRTFLQILLRRVFDGGADLGSFGTFAVAFAGWAAMHLPAIPCAVLERTDAWTSFERARRLTFGRRRGMFALVVVAAIPPVLTLLGLARGFELFGDEAGESGLTAAVVAAVGLPFVGAVCAVGHDALRALDATGGHDLGTVFD